MDLIQFPYYYFKALTTVSSKVLPTKEELLQGTERSGTLMLTINEFCTD